MRRMGILQRLGLVPSRYVAPPPEELASPILWGVANTLDDLSVEELYRDQPYLRTVVDFIARSVASTSLHVYTRDADGGRQRVRDTNLADLTLKANPTTLMQTLLHNVVADMCLFDEAFIAVVEKKTRFELLHIPPTLIVKRVFKDEWELDYIVVRDEKGAVQKYCSDALIRLHGYRPGDDKHGLSPVFALKDLLKEQIEAAAYRGQLWKNGARLGGVITRPSGATWDANARARFKAAWQAQYTGKGSGAGGTPILEDGMEFKPAHLKADDEQFVDVAKLSLATVAGVFHINPTMVGLLDNANYSNVREFRKSLYGDSLGPIFKLLESTFNAFLLPMIGEETDTYVEFNLDEKLRGSFEEKAAVTSRAVGAPWMTRNEARAMNNLPAVDGGDELIMPLNLSTVDADSAEEGVVES